MKTVVYLVSINFDDELEVKDVPTDSAYVRNELRNDIEHGINSVGYDADVKLLGIREMEE